MPPICINGDCLEVMKGLPDKSVDLFMCDLPYGCLTSPSGGNIAKTGKGGSTFGSTGCLWDIKIDLEAFWVQVKRLCKNDNTPVLMFCNTRFGVELINSNPNWFRYDMVWNKLSGTNFLNANKLPMQSHELVYVFSKKGAFYKRIDMPVEGKKPYCMPESVIKHASCYAATGLQTHKKQQIDSKRCPLSVINFKRVHNKRHPTCKSVELYKWLIERYSNEGNTVLDPTAGSFNSGRAAVELGREYIGIEMDEKFYNENHLVESDCLVEIETEEPTTVVIHEKE